MKERKNRIPDLFGSMVFNEEVMSQYVSPGAMKAWHTCLKEEKTLNLDVANDIADGMKTWALEHGAPGDVIVLCGKGHEPYQEVRGQRHRLDEREIVAEYLKEL